MVDETIKEFLDLEEVAKYLGVHINTIYKYMKDETNPLPTFKISDRVVRVNKTDLDIWLEGYKNAN